MQKLNQHARSMCKSHLSQKKNTKATTSKHRIHEQCSPTHMMIIDFPQPSFSHSYTVTFIHKNLPSDPLVTRSEWLGLTWIHLMCVLST